MEHQHRFRSRGNASVNSATPLVSGGQIFLSASYNTGALLLEDKGWKRNLEERRVALEPLHDQREGGRLPLRHPWPAGGIAGAALRRVEDGQVAWAKEGFGCAWLIAADGLLLAVQESGEFALLEANPKEYRELSRFAAFGKPAERGKSLARCPHWPTACFMCAMRKSSGRGEWGRNKRVSCDAKALRSGVR